MPREPLAARRRRAATILERLRRAYPGSHISLEYETPMQLLAAVILSAQCTDAMVNRVTARLFQTYRTVDDFADADEKTFSLAIRPTGFYRSKARHIIAAAHRIRARHQGNLPRTLEELVELPGVGRKTANVILWNAFRTVEGIAVDTHVARISHLLRLAHARDPIGIERELMRTLPRPAWGHATHLLIDHGRAVCIARRPRCERCVLNDLCPSALRSPENSAPPPRLTRQGRVLKRSSRPTA